MKNPVRVGLDIDGVVYDWDSQVRRVVKNKFCVEIPGPSPTWNFVGEFLSRRDEAIEKWLWDKGGGLIEMFSDGDPYPGAVEAVREISGLAQIVILTSVPGPAIYSRTRWLDKWGVPCNEMFVGRAPKSMVYPWCDIYIDDGPPNITEFLAFTGGKVVVWERPWNDDLPNPYHPRLVRTNDWRLVIDLIREMGGDRHE